MSDLQPPGIASVSEPQHRLPTKKNTVRRIVVVAAFIAVSVVLLAYPGRSILSNWCNHLGNAAVKQRDLATAATWYRYGRTIYGVQGYSDLGLARVERLSGHPSQMQAHLKEAEIRGIPPTPLRREFLLAEIQSGRLRDYQHEIPDLLMQAGDDAPAVSEALASGYFQAYRLNEAMALIEAWRRDYPDDPQPMVVRGSYFLQRQAWNNAAGEFEQALQLSPGRTDIRLLWAECLYQLQQLSAAREQFERCVEADPDEPVALIGAGRCLFETGEMKRAEELLRRALKIAPDSWDGRLNLGKLLTADDQPAAAIPYLEPVCRERPYAPNARYALALALKAANRDQEAEIHFQYVLEQQQAQSELRNKLERLEREPRRVDLRLEIGKTLLKYGDPLEGRGWLQSVLEIEPMNSEALTALSESRSNDTLLP